LRTTLHTLAFLAGAFAAALDQRGSYKCYNDTVSKIPRTLETMRMAADSVQYDDISASIVPLLSPIGNYHGLKYEGFVVAVSHSVGFPYG